MQHLLSDIGKEAKQRDVVYTPDDVVQSIINHFSPTGRILDPCAGDGAFQKVIPDCLWCEIDNGRDFFEWNEHVDWVIGNPPYSILNAWMDHSFKIADNIVYLLPIAKVFGSRKRLLAIRDYGGIAEIYTPWTGRMIGFEFGWACGAVHFKRGYNGDMKLTLDR